MKNKKPLLRPILQSIPDWTSWKEAENWIKREIQASKKVKADTSFISMDWKEIQGSVPIKNRFGLYTSEAWRKFVYGVFLADLICYPKPVDQVRFDQLTGAMIKFPQGFRIWWGKLGKNWVPCGYSAWIPMQYSLFNTFMNRPEELEDRTVPPGKFDPKRPIFYLFNYSVAPQFKKTTFAKVLLQSLSKDLGRQKPWGLAAITVSDDGSRVAQRFGMKKTGNLVLKGSTESVYCGILK